MSKPKDPFLGLYRIGYLQDGISYEAQQLDPRQYVEQILSSMKATGSNNTSVDEYATNLYGLPAPLPHMSPRDYNFLAVDLAFKLTYAEQLEGRLGAFLMGLEKGTLELDRKEGKAYTNFEPCHYGYDFYDRASRAIEALGGYCATGSMLGL